MKWLVVAAVLMSTTLAAAARDDHFVRDRDRHGWYVPDYAKLQTGGYTGLFTAGLGYAAFSDVLNIGVDYGYVPAAHAGRNVHSVSAGVSVRPFDFRIGDVRIVPAYVGADLLFTWGDDYFITVADYYYRYNRFYYYPTGAHWMIHLGLELDWVPPNGNFFERHGLYWELRTLDTYFFSYLENPATLHFTDVLASALGYRAAF